MSATLIELVWQRSRSSGSAKMVLLAIANAAGDDQMADLTVAEIAEAAEIKERQTQRCLRAIEALGELVIATVHGRAQRNHFIVTLSLEKVSPTTPFSDRTSEKVSPMTPFSDEKASPMTPIAEKASSMTPFPLAPPDMPDRSNAGSTTEKVSPRTPFSATGDNNLLDTPKEISSPPEISPEKKQRSSSQLAEKPSFAPDSTPMLLAERLRDRILATLPEAKVPKTPAQMQPWARTFDLMIRVDHRGQDSIIGCIDYAHAEPFWQAHVLSADSLRKHYQTLEVQRHARTRAHQQRRSSGAASRPAAATADYWAEEARRQAERQSKQPTLPRSTEGQGPIIARAAS